MGGCVLKPKQKVKSNAKYFYKSCKFGRNIAPAVPVAPVEHFTDAENYAIDFSVQELASLDIQSSETTICCMSKLQILTFQHSKLQQKHNELGTNDLKGSIRQRRLVANEIGGGDFAKSVVGTSPETIRRSPNTILFAKNTGKISQTDFHPAYDANRIIEFNEPVHFYLTRNLQSFFSHFGVEGLIVTDMRAASQAVVSPKAHEWEITGLILTQHWTYLEARNGRPIFKNGKIPWPCNSVSIEKLNHWRTPNGNHWTYS
ncbi:Non-specific serine/threonine protein kinase [Forsythia ovata]|uniref:Non-specific serine/threonine protein kinase n=1 Tax=Forsythia ovata TaxID=205694 RepID=A0ABD1WII5_9LAMI